MGTESGCRGEQESERGECARRVGRSAARVGCQRWAEANKDPPAQVTPSGNHQRLPDAALGARVTLHFHPQTQAEHWPAEDCTPSTPWLSVEGAHTCPGGDYRFLTINDACPNKKQK